MTAPTIGFAGMTHLGLNSSAVAAEKKFDVICFDQDENLIAQLASGDLHIVEPQLPEAIAANAQQISFVHDASELAKCDVVYIASDVATNDEGKSDLSGLESLLNHVSGAVKPNAVVVILSQVPPGFTRQYAGKISSLYYQVETLIFGRAMERAQFPERFIIGCENSDQPLPMPLMTYLKSFDCPILSMRYESAELAKISINCCLVSSISVANTLAELCEQVGADWSEIMPALKLDGRIGPDAYLTPGLGIAGGNLERDLVTVRQLAQANRTDDGVVAAWVHNSAHRKNWVYNILEKEVFPKHPNPQIGVLGLAYKENTDSTKNSPSVALLRQLDGKRVKVFDPVVRETIAPNIVSVASANEVFASADVVVIMTPWPVFGEINLSALAAAMSGKYIIDPYGIFDGKSVADVGLHYFTLGTPPIMAGKR